MMLKIADGRDSLYQWDLDAFLIVTEPEGVTIEEVHFANALSKKAIPVPVVRVEGVSKVGVPYDLLQTPLTIYAYCYCECNGGGTRSREDFPVVARPKPDDYPHPIDQVNEVLAATLAGEPISGVLDEDRLNKLPVILTETKTAVENTGVEVKEDYLLDDIPESVNEVFEAGTKVSFDIGYNAGYAEAKEEVHSDYINPEWTNWSYFCYGRDSLVSKLKYTDTRNGTNFGQMFRGCNVNEIPLIDTSKGTTFASMFVGCRNITTIPEIDTSNGTDFENMFDSCVALTSIPILNMRKAKTAASMFNWCNKLTSIPLMNVTNVKVGMIEFKGCTSLVYIRFEGTIPVSINFQYSPLDLDSAKNAIGCLPNYAGTENEFKYSAKFSATTWGYLDAEGETASPNGNSWREYITELGWLI